MLSEREKKQISIDITMMLFREIDKGSDNISPAEIIELVARLFVGLVVAAAKRERLTRLEVRDQMNAGLNEVFDSCWDYFASHRDENRPPMTKAQTQKTIREMIERAGFRAP